MHLALPAVLSTLGHLSEAALEVLGLFRDPRGFVLRLHRLQERLGVLKLVAVPVVKPSVLIVTNPVTAIT